MHILKSPWHRLAGRDDLLIQVDVSEGYAIRVTDLKNVWAEDASSKDIKNRADELNCPVAVDVDNSTLMQRLRQSLISDTNESDLTVEMADDMMHLKIKDALGRGYTIEWYFTCIIAEPSITNQLVLGLYRMISFRQDSESELLTTIKDKDAMITQMLEHCKSAGVSYKPVRRTAALQPFSETDWKHRRREVSKEECKTAEDVLAGVNKYAQQASSTDDWKAALQHLHSWKLTDDERPKSSSSNKSHLSESRMGKTSQVKSRIGGKHKVRQVSPSPQPVKEVESPIAKWKLRDSWESQEIEADIDLNASDASNETQDPSDDETLSVPDPRKSPETPKKARVLNLISPRKPKEPVIEEADEEEEDDEEAVRKKRAMEKRARLEEIIAKTPKKPRRF